MLSFTESKNKFELSNLNFNKQQINLLQNTKQNNLQITNFPFQNKLGLTASGFRSQSSNKKDDFYIFAKLNKKELFGYDNERLQETILNLKKEINQKSKEINRLRVELNLIDLEDKKKLKIIENILSSAGKNFEEIISLIDDNKNIDNINLNPNSLIKLREIYVINFLKSQVGQLKAIINDKKEEIAILKENSKVSKISQLEIENQAIKNENIQLKLNFERINTEDENLKNNYSNLQLEHEILYKKYLKKQRDLEKFNLENRKLEEDNKVLLKDKKKSDEESNKYKVTMINMKSDLKNKTEYWNFTKTSEDKITKLEKDNENLIKRIESLTKEKAKFTLQTK